MPQVAGLVNQSAAAGNGLTAAGALRASALGPLNIYATMQGQRVLRDHYYTVSAISVPMMRAILASFGHAMAETAKAIHSPNIDTGATYESIQSSLVDPLPGGGSIDVFVTTDYAKFLEFGFVHHLSGKWIFNPFMIPAADLIVPYFIDAIQQISGLVGSRRHLTGPAAATPASVILGSARAGLYSYSKFAGDIQALGITGLSKSRGFALKGAKGIGNYQAAQAGTSVSRFIRVQTGKYGGKYGRSGVVSGFGGSALSGPAARIYNRIGGRAFGGALSDIKLPGF